MKVIDREAAPREPARPVRVYGTASPSSASSPRAPEESVPFPYTLSDASTWRPLPPGDRDIIFVGQHLLIAPTVEDRIRALHQQSGLTWEQLARLFGVSRRSVHLWATGNRMSTANLERLGRIEQAITPLLHLGPKRARERLMLRVDGMSLYADLLRSVSEAQPESEPRSWIDRYSVEDP